MCVIIYTHTYPSPLWFSWGTTSESLSVPSRQAWGRWPACRSVRDGSGRCRENTKPIGLIIHSELLSLMDYSDRVRWLAHCRPNVGSDNLSGDSQNNSSRDNGCSPSIYILRFIHLFKQFSWKQLNLPETSYRNSNNKLFKKKVLKTLFVYTLLSA